MDQAAQRLESYVKELRAGQKGVPGSRRDSINFRAISAATGIDFSYLIEGPGRRRVMLAVQEIGITSINSTQPPERERLFNQKQTLLHNYLQWLRDKGHKLPENPTRKGKVYFEQVAIEAGFKPQSLSLRKVDAEQGYRTLLCREIDKAALTIGIEVRVLPQSPGQQQTLITYQQLLEKGAEVRAKNLSGKPKDAQQIYNMRSALNRFLKTLHLDRTSTVGHELASDFKISLTKVTKTITNNKSRKKFQTEIWRWRDLYQQMLKAPLIPDDLNQAILQLVSRSGLTYTVMAKLVGVTGATMTAWCNGIGTPSPVNVPALRRMEALLKIPAGALVNKVVRKWGSTRFRTSQLPSFLQQDQTLYRKIRLHLPNDFCTLPLENQEQIVQSICTDTLCGDDHSRRTQVLISLPYRMNNYPETLRVELDAYIRFKVDERSPLGMQRNGTWKPASKVKRENDFSYLFGAICLPPDAEDERLRGLGFSTSDLTLSLIACPRIIDWYIRFRCEVRNQYTNHSIQLLQHFISMLRANTGWLRQCSHLARRLKPIVCGDTELISPDLVSRAQADWHGVCEDAIKEYKGSIARIESLITVARDPFHRIEGILDMNDPMNIYAYLLEEMKRDLPNPHTQPVLYHTAIRNCALITLLVVTGFRRGTTAKLEYTGNNKGHLYLVDGQYVLSVPRKLFKNDNSSYFGPLRAKKDYLNRLPDKFGLNEVFKEYLEVSRPFLMGRYHKGSSEQPLFVKSAVRGQPRTETKSARLSEPRISQIYYRSMEMYLIESKHRGTGFPRVKRTGPHSLRHVRGTTTYRKTQSFKLAGDANQNSEATAREHYSRFSTEEHNLEVNKILFDV